MSRNVTKKMRFNTAMMMIMQCRKQYGLAEFNNPGGWPRHVSEYQALGYATAIRDVLVILKREGLIADFNLHTNQVSYGDGTVSQPPEVMPLKFVETPRDPVAGLSWQTPDWGLPDSTPYWQGGCRSVDVLIRTVTGHYYVAYSWKHPDTDEVGWLLAGPECCRVPEPIERWAYLYPKLEKS